MVHAEGAPTLPDRRWAQCDRARARKRRSPPRTPVQDAYMQRHARARARLRHSARPAPARPISPSPAPPRCSTRGEVDRIVLSRPAVEAGERLGFLPGDMKEKVDPYLRPLYDALYDMMPARAGASAAWPTARSRSRRSPSCAAARCAAPSSSSTRRRTPRRMQMKMFLTRLGEGSRMVVTGDPTQIDLPPGRVVRPRRSRRAFSAASKASPISRFTSADIVRHPLVARIVAAYEQGGRKPPGRKG